MPGTPHQTPKTMYLVRHAQSDWNVEARYVSRTDRQLSEEGWRQIASTGRRLSGEPIEAVYSSPLARARTTAEAIGDARGVDVIVRGDLTEIDFGDWEGSTYDELMGAFRSFEAWLASPETNQIPGGESWEDFSSRVVEAVDHIVAQPYSAVAVVSHAGWLKMMLGLALDMKRIVFRNIRVDHCSISITQVNGPHWQGATALTTLNDTCHLRD